MKDVDKIYDQYITICEQYKSIWINRNDTVRYLLEKSWILPDKDDPQYSEIKREIEEYSKIKRGRELPSGAKFQGDLAVISEHHPNTLTPEQARDYGLPASSYKFLGRGAESIVYTNGKNVYKFAKDKGSSISNIHIGEGRTEVWVSDPEDILEDRFRKCRDSKKVDSIPPIELADTSKFFMPYWEYKNQKEQGKTIEFPEEVIYHKSSKGFAFVNRYTFDSLNIYCMDNGIIVQDILPNGVRDLTRNEKIDIASHMSNNGVHVDKFNIGNNIKIGKNKIYVMD